MKFNKKNIIWIAVLLSIYTNSTIVAATNLSADKILRSNHTKLKFSPNRLIVRYKNKKSFNTLSSRAKSIGLSSRTIASTTSGAVISVVKIRQGINLADALKAYEADPNVASVSYDYYRELYTTPNDPSYTGQANGVNEMWGLNDTAPDLTELVPQKFIFPNTADKTVGNDIDAHRAWEIWDKIISDAKDAKTEVKVIVAVIDTGVDFTHPDLVNAMWDGSNATIAGVAAPTPNHGIDTADGDNDPYPIPDEHGTHVAGTIAATANNGIGILGVAYGVKIMAVKVASDIAGLISDSSLISGINYAVENGADIINLSLGGPSKSAALTDVVIKAVKSGVLLVVAAGNSTQDNDLVEDWPSNYANFPTTKSGVISVAATDQADLIAFFSSFGANSVNIGAPGVNIKSTITGLEVKPENSASGINILPPADVNVPSPNSGDASHPSCATEPNVCFANSFFSATGVDCVGSNCTWGWIRFNSGSSLSVLGGNPADLTFDPQTGDLTNLPLYANSIDGIITSQLITNTPNTKGTKTILSYYASWDLECNVDYVDVKVYDGNQWVLLSADNNGYNINETLKGGCHDPATNINDTTIPFTTSLHTLTGRMGSYILKFFPDEVIPFRLISHDISQYNNPLLRVQFRYVTNSTVNSTTVPFGVILDEIKISTQVVDYTNSYGYKSGTSMAAPHVAGIAALIKGANSTFTGVEIKARLLSSADANASLVGKTTSGGRANAYNAISGSPGASLPPPPVQQNNSGNSGGCTLANGAKFDPLLPSMLILALLILLRKFKINKQSNFV